MSRWIVRLSLLAGGLLVLAVVWWGWHKGGLALMQPGMGTC